MLSGGKTVTAAIVIRLEAARCRSRDRVTELQQRHQFALWPRSQPAEAATARHAGTASPGGGCLTG